MNLDTELTWDKARQVVDRLLCQQTDKHLSDIEIVILRGAWEDKTYEEIAEAEGYSSSYLSKDVGNKLWQNLSVALQERVSKKNFKAALQREWYKRTRAASSEHQAQIKEVIAEEKLNFPEGSIALGSPFYIERSRCESVCYQNVVKPGSLIRIKGAKWMGKTSLMHRILERAVNCQHRTVYLDFDSIERSILQDLNKLLRWLCAMVSRQLQLINKVSELWDTDILGSNDNCTVYFEEYVLAQITDKIVLAFDNVDKLFAHNETVEDFFGMLRSWHEKGKTYQCWSQLKLVLAHSTEVYVPLDINQSPFNAGIPILLEEFDIERVKKLANLYQLDWNEAQILQLMSLVGGHPYLIRLGMYQIKTQGTTLARLLQEATLETGIYSNPLRRLSNILKRSPELNMAFQTIVQSNIPVALDSRQIYQLHGLGLVKYEQNLALPRCKLYRDYFSE